MLREQEKELRETEEKRTRLVKEVWTGSHDIYSQACPARNLIPDENLFLS